MSETQSRVWALWELFYGALMRLSGAVGLHHMIYPMFWYTELGGVETVAGAQVVGAQKIFFAQLADPAFTGMYTCTPTGRVFSRGASIR